MGRARRFAAFLVPAVPCAAWTVFAGKDVNWDLLNYHYYAPFALVTGRLQQDLLAASAQSYLNPVGYLPFYLMVHAGWHSVAVSALLAAFHGLSLSLLFLLAWKLFGHLPQRERLVMSGLAAALGAATAVFWATVGTSFLDPLLAPLMLGGLVALLHGNQPFVAGLLFGAAAALKYSNAVFALAAIPLALVSGRHALAAYAIGGASSVALLAGPWIVLMMREFGDPLFPGLTAAGGRFAPRDWLTALVFPFRMVALDRGLYAEIFAPDLRFAALALCAVALPAVRRSIGDWRLLGFFALGYAAWLASSANARYGMVLLLLAGVCLAYLVERLVAPRGACIVLGALLLAQLAAVIVASPSRWFIAEPWSQRWLPYYVPERALREPALYLTLETLPMAVAAAFVHRQSSFVNLRGQRSLPPDSQRLAALLERHRGRARVLGRALLPVDGRPPAGEVQAYDGTLARIGYRIDADDCFTIEWRRDDADRLSRAANWLSGTRPSSEPLSVASCGLQAAARDPALEERAQRASELFDRIQRTCPSYFRGQTALTEPFGRGWSRHYVDLDARLEAFGDRVVLNRYRSGEIIDLSGCR